MVAHCSWMIPPEWIVHDYVFSSYFVLEKALLTVTSQSLTDFVVVKLINSFSGGNFHCFALSNVIAYWWCTYVTGRGREHVLDWGICPSEHILVCIYCTFIDIVSLWMYKLTTQKWQTYLLSTPSLWIWVTYSLSVYQIFCSNCEDFDGFYHGTIFFILFLNLRNQGFCHSDCIYKYFCLFNCDFLSFCKLPNFPN